MRPRIRYPEPPAFLVDMPRKVLHGKAEQIEKWLKDNGKQRPTLLHLEAARRKVRKR